MVPSQHAGMGGCCENSRVCVSQLLPHQRERCASLKVVARARWGVEVKVQQAGRTRDVITGDSIPYTSGFRISTDTALGRLQAGLRLNAVGQRLPGSDMSRECALSFLRARRRPGARGRGMQPLSARRSRCRHRGLRLGRLIRHVEAARVAAGLELGQQQLSRLHGRADAAGPVVAAGEDQLLKAHLEGKRGRARFAGAGGAVHWCALSWAPRPSARPSTPSSDSRCRGVPGNRS
jgi:hypothetical protein